MGYVPDDPEEGEAFVIPLVERCPKLRAIFEAIRHGLPAPDLTDCSDDDHQPPQSTASKPSKPPHPQPVAPFQEAVTAPTDAECGLPSPLAVAVAEIPSRRLPLARVLASPLPASVITGFTRRECAESLAHAANLRRATGRARAILVVAASETAVREWISGMCEALDEVQLISFSRARMKRDAALRRLRGAHYPGIVVASQKTLTDGARELWEALRENSVVRKWEVVVSEGVSDKNVDAECSPLRMVRDGLAEKGVVVPGKGLSEQKACEAARDLRGVDVEKGFWLGKEDVRKLALEEAAKKGDGGTALLEGGKQKLSHTRAIKPKARKSRPSPVGKENRLLPGTEDADGNRTPEPTKKAVQQGPVTAKSRRKESDTGRRGHNSKDHSPVVDTISKTVPSTKGNRKVSGGVVKSPKRKDSTLRAKTTKDAVASGNRKMLRGIEEPLSKLEKTKAEKKTCQVPPKNAAKNGRLSDRMRRALLRDTAGVSVKKTTSTTTKSAEAQTQPLLGGIPRRRSPRLSPTLSSSEPSSTISAAGKPRSRKRRSSELRKEKEAGAIRSTVGNKRSSKSQISSSRGRSDVNIEVGMSSSEETEKTLSRKTREMCESRARALHLDGSGSTSSSQDRFYTPPSRPPTPQSDDTAPERFFSARTSFSPKKKLDSFGEPAPKSGKTPPYLSVSPGKSSSPQRHSETLKPVAPKPHKPVQEMLLSPRSSISPHKRERKRKKSRRLDLAYDSSEDKPLTSRMADLKQKTGRRAVKAAVTPGPVKRNVTSHGSSNQVSNAERSKVVGQPSVFEGPMSSEFQSKHVYTGIRRTMSFPAPVLMKRGDSPPPGSFIWTWGNPKYKASTVTSRRKSLPSSSTRACVLPMKRALPEQGKTSHGAPARSVTPKRGPRAMRVSSRDRFSSTPPRHEVPVDTVPLTSNQAEPEVIVISSGTEDEETPRTAKVSKRRRIFDHDEARRDSRDLAGVRPRKVKTSWVKSAVTSRGRDKDTSRSKESRSMHRDGTSSSRHSMEKGSGSHSRSDNPNSATIVPREDLASFMRGVNLTRTVKDLSSSQESEYNKYMAEGRRFENMNMRKEAIDSYQRCVDIYDSDPHLIGRIFALASTQGCLRADDFGRRPPKSPIRKRSRRRRRSGRKAQADRHSSRVEVIDLTSP